MKLALSVHLGPGGDRAAAVAFDEWDAALASRSYSATLADAAPVPATGPDARRLACLLNLLHTQALQPELLLIEGFVHLDAQETPGLGQQLFLALGGRTPVIGVARAPLPGTPAQCQVSREEDAPPLIVTCTGMDLGAAKARLRAMHGRRRVPTLLKLVARLAKNAEG